jgi:hypothetical protein
VFIVAPFLSVLLLAVIQKVCLRFERSRQLISSFGDFWDTGTNSGPAEHTCAPVPFSGDEKLLPVRAGPAVVDLQTNLKSRI